MSLDFPRGWEIARASKMEDHDERCSYRQARGGFLCDCDVITKHPEMLDERMFTRGGVVYVRPEKI